MADDFDIEAYLEAQVDGATKKGEGAKSDEATSRSDRRDGDDKLRKDKDRSGKDKKDRSSSRDKDRHRDRDRSRSREKGRDKDRKKDKKRSKSRSRSRSREKRRDRSAERKSKTAEMDAEAEKLRLQKEAELAAKREEERRKREINDLTKDQRTVFVSQLTMKVDEKMIKKFFTQIGDVNDVIMIRDKYTGRHKGFAYVEMADLEKIPTCLMLNACVPDFQKFPILVKASEAEKNFLAKKETTPVATAASDSGLLQASDSRLYVGNLHVNITEDDLRVVLSQFGKVESVNIPRDEVGTSRGYAFVRYSRPDEAHGAFSKLAGLELAGKPIKVGYVNDSAGATTSSSQGSSGNWKLDDDEGAGMQMNAQSRVMLMAKLGQGAGISVPMPMNPIAMQLAMPSVAPTPVSGTAKAPPVSGSLSRFILIKNMFVLAEEKGDSWDEDIQEDVFEECRKFGSVEQVVVDKIRPGGYVFVKFTDADSASKAANSLNGRWFAGKMITVSFIEASQFSNMSI